MTLFVLMTLWWAMPSLTQAMPFQGDGKDYVIHVYGRLWVFSRVANTSVTVRRISDNQVLWQTSFGTSGLMAAWHSATLQHVRVTSNQPVTIAIGNIGDGIIPTDAYASHLISENGSRFGKNFEGFTRSDLMIFCPQGQNARITITDVSNQGTANDKSTVLTSANAEFNVSDVTIWYLNNFANDQIRIASTHNCSVKVGHRFKGANRNDWSVTPPSVHELDRGLPFGRKFYMFVHKTMTIIPLQDNTQVSIRDLSDGDDSRTLTLNRNQFFSARPLSQAYNGFQQVNPSPANEFDDDYVEVTADKPVWVYVGPVTADANGNSIAPVSIPLGSGEQETFCFVQKSAAKNFQIFVSDNNAKVEIQTMAGNSNLGTTRRTIGTGGHNWNGPSDGPFWWETDLFDNELIHVRSNKPMAVYCGDFDKASWKSFISFETPNTPPKISIPGGLTYQVRVGQTLTFTLTGSDDDGDTLTWTFGTLPTGAQRTGSGNTYTCTWTPSSGQEGNYTWVVEIRDSGYPPITTRVTITIEVLTSISPNRPPIFVSTPVGTAQLGKAYVYTARAEDPDGDPVTYQLIRSATGTQFNAATGQLTWTPDANDIGGSFVFQVRACDNKAACTDQTWNVTVSRTNTPPRFISVPLINATEGQLYTYVPQVVDPDPGDMASLRWWMRGPAGMQMDIRNGTLTWTPNSTQGGQYFWTELVVCDDFGDCVGQQWEIYVINVNNKPQITSVPPTKAVERRTYSYTPTFKDPDPNDKHTWQLTRSPSNVTFDAATGAITWTPSSADVGQFFTFTLVICDQDKNCDTQTWSVEVIRANTPPSITSTPPTTATRGVNYVHTPTATDPDPNEIFTWRLLRGSSDAQIDQTTGRISWTPGTADGGKTIAFEIQVCDRANECDNQSWNVLVRDINTAPRITSTPPSSATENQPYSYTPRFEDPDPNDTHTWQLTEAPTGVQINSNTGAISWIPGAAHGGRFFNFGLQICDRANACDTQTWVVNVINVNNAPMISSTPPTVAIAVQLYTYNPVVDDPDPADTHTWSLLRQAQGALIDARSGRITWTPALTDQGQSFGFSLQVCDQTKACNTQDWTVTVTSSNQAPKITSFPPTSATQGVVYTYAATVLDPDPGDTHIWRLISAPPSAKIDPNQGIITWTPDSDDTNAKIRSFKLEVCDRANACATQDWEVTISYTNAPPSITSTPPTTAIINKRYTYAVIAVDPNPGDQAQLKYSLKKGPVGANIDAKTGVMTWTPSAADLNGEYECIIEVCDPQNACITQTWKIRVLDANNPPQIVSTPPNVAYVGENLNYQASAIDLDAGDILVWRLIKGPSNCSIDPKTGLVQWIPPASDEGQIVNFEIEVCDSVNPPDCNTQSFQVTVYRKCIIDMHCSGKQICVQQGRFRICIDPGCAAKIPQCAEGLFCKDGKCETNPCSPDNCPTKICRPPDGCIRSCAGIKCPVGSICIDGSCEPTPCITNVCKPSEVCDTSDQLKPKCTEDPCLPNVCKHGRICSQGRCIDDPCLSMTCPEGQQCFAGQCIDPKACNIDLDCIGDQVCENRKCIDPGCYIDIPRCPSRDDVCLATACKDNPCADNSELQCAEGLFCRPTDGACVAVCDEETIAKCNPDERCSDGKCRKDPCAGRQCPAGKNCVEGACLPDYCADANVCKHGRVCNKNLNRCEDDPCLFISCPKGLSCQMGQCRPKGCRVDKDCPGIQLCIDGVCKIPGCPPCDKGKLCIDGLCKDDPCTDLKCEENQFCQGGKCVDICAITCPQGMRCLQGKCVYDPCAGINCPNGESCINGACRPDCCEADSCKQDRICRNCKCHPNPCAGVVCPDNRSCNPKDGQCSPPPCNIDQPQCPGDQVCIDGQCYTPGCYEESKACANGKICLKGQCVDNPCKEDSCPEGQICRPVDGKCLLPCPFCEVGEICKDGKCIPNPCAEISCEEGQICRDGTCAPMQPCERSENNPSSKICKYTRLCTSRTDDPTDDKPYCNDDPCYAMSCPINHTCIDGICHALLCQGEQIDEACVSTEPISTDAGVIPESEPCVGENCTRDDEIREPKYRPTGGCGCSLTNHPLHNLFSLFLLALALAFALRKTKSSQQ
jgi:hypothetical protein